MNIVNDLLPMVPRILISRQIYNLQRRRPTPRYSQAITSGWINVCLYLTVPCTAWWSPARRRSWWSCPRRWESSCSQCESPHVHVDSVRVLMLTVWWEPSDWWCGLYSAHSTCGSQHRRQTCPAHHGLHHTLPRGGGRPPLHCGLNWGWRWHK